MKHANAVSGVVLTLFGLVTLFIVIPWQIEPGPKDIMSPRLVPSMMMIIIIALSALLTLTNVRAIRLNPQEASKPPVSRFELMALLKIGAVFALAIMLYLLVSPLAAGAALVIGTLIVLGERRPLVLILMPTALLLAIWFLFYKVLGTAIL